MKAIFLALVLFSVGSFADTFIQSNSEVNFNQEIKVTNQNNYGKSVTIDGKLVNDIKCKMATTLVSNTEYRLHPASSKGFVLDIDTYKMTFVVSKISFEVDCVNFKSGSSAQLTKELIESSLPMTINVTGMRVIDL